MVIKLIRAKEQFLSFTNESSAMLESMRREAKKKNPDYRLLMRYMHTIKGGAALFGELQVKEKAHGIESWIMDWTDGKAAPDADFQQELSPKLSELEAAQHEFFNMHQDIIGRKFGDTERRTEIPLSNLEKFLGKIEAIPQAKNLSQEFLDEFIKEPCLNLLSHYDSAIKTTAQNLNKKVKSLQIEGGEIKVLNSRYSELFSSFIHLFRNAVDHGIETYKRRVEQGKDAAAQISVKIIRENKNGKRWLTISISDDGGGIDPSRIRAKMVSQGKEAQINKETDEEIIQHIFDAGFSTKEEVTYLSGRGVGLDMVMNTAQKLGGTASVKTKKDAGSTFIISVPEHDEV